MNPDILFNQSKVEYFDCTDATIAYRKFGKGFPLILIHGFPVHGYTWRFLIPELHKNFTCYVLDLPGLGLSKWSKETNFHFEAQAERIIEFMKSLVAGECSILAQDTGATTARLVALHEELKIKTLVLFNTEVPHHRPPWIQLYQKSSLIPGAHHIFKASLKNKMFLKSAMGLKAFYTNKKLLEDESYISPYLDLITNSDHRMKGALAYLRGCDLKYMDALEEKHKEINARVIIIWGEDDVTFPLSFGESLADQFDNVEFHAIQNASLMPHEEKPEEILKIIHSKLI